MKKIVLAGLFIAAFVAYVFLRHSDVAPAITSPDLTQTSTGSNNSSSGSTPPPGTSTVLKDGIYTGPVTDAYYGNVQVRATISNGKLTDIQFLQYPNDRHESVQISNASMPILRSEAIQAQSANVDIVSGATQTSEAFIKSLGSALAQAKS